MRLNTNHTHIMDADRRAHSSRGFKRSAETGVNQQAGQLSSALSSPQDVYQSMFGQLPSAEADMLASESAANDIFTEENPLAFQMPDDIQSQRSSGDTDESADLQDNSASLTRRLVAANSMLSIQMIIADAFKDLGSLRLAAAMAEDSSIAEKANQIIRRLERLVRRGNRKITDLNKEDALQRKMDRAEKDEQMQRAREIEAELRRQILNRRRRENGYLDELTREEMAASHEHIASKINSSLKLDAATEAKIAAMAQAMATAEALSSASGSSGFDSAGGSSSGTSSAGQVGSISGAEGGGTGGEGFVSGSLDVSV